MASERHRKCVYASIRWVKREAATAAASSSLFDENSDSRNGIYVFRFCHCVCASAVAAVGGYFYIFVVFSLQQHIDTYSHKTAFDRQISHSSWIYGIFANAIADTICGGHTSMWRLAQALGAGKHCTWQPSDMNKFVLVTEFHLHSACLGQRYQFTVLRLYVSRLWFSVHGRARATLSLALYVCVCVSNSARPAEKCIIRSNAPSKWYFPFRSLMRRYRCRRRESWIRWFRISAIYAQNTASSATACGRECVRLCVLSLFIDRHFVVPDKCVGIFVHFIGCHSHFTMLNFNYTFVRRWLAAGLRIVVRYKIDLWPLQHQLTFNVVKDDIHRRIGN